jgi:hypothetical protein
MRVNPFLKHCPPLSNPDHRPQSSYALALRELHAFHLRRNLRPEEITFTQREFRTQLRTMTAPKRVSCTTLVQELRAPPSNGSERQQHLVSGSSDTCFKFCKVNQGRDPLQMAVFQPSSAWN